MVDKGIDIDLLRDELEGTTAHFHDFRKEGSRVHSMTQTTQ